MAEKMKCEYCEKEAIGYQGYGCCSAYVCLDHADSFVLALKPGESLTSGNVTLSGFLSPIENTLTFRITHTLCTDFAGIENILSYDHGDYIPFPFFFKKEVRGGEESTVTNLSVSCLSLWDSPCMCQAISCIRWDRSGQVDCQCLF